MLLDGVELGVRQLARLVQDLRRDEQLADVVQQRRPPQVIQGGAGDLQLLADHVGVGTHPLGVPARETVVHAEGGDELEQLLGGLGRCVTDPPGAGVGNDLAQLQRRADAHRDLEPGGRLVGERERQAEQHRQREQPASDAVEGDHHRCRRDRDQHPAQDRHRPRRHRRQDRRERPRERHRRGERHDEHEHPDARVPPMDCRSIGLPRSADKSRAPTVRPSPPPSPSAADTEPLRIGSSLVGGDDVRPQRRGRAGSSA